MTKTEPASLRLRLGLIVFALALGTAFLLESLLAAPSQAAPWANPPLPYQIFLPLLNPASSSSSATATATIADVGTPTATLTDSPIPSDTATNTPTIFLSATITPTATNSPTLTATPTVDPRFAVIVSGNVTNTVTALGLTWWYSFGNASPGGPGNGVAQISLRPTHGAIIRVPAATLQANAQAHPGAHWIIGNEPNVGGQDSISGSQFATELNYYVTTIKGADPTAQIVGPNALNWDTTCISGCSFTPGHTWVDQLRSAWATQFGGEPPIDVWAMHAYAIDWYNTPMTNATDIATDEQEIASFSTYLAGIPAHAAKPIWITEMGILWAYPGWTPVSSGCAAPPNCIAPTGTYDTAGVVNFLNQFIPWLKSNSSTYRLGKWFVYVSYGMPDPYQTQYGGISLLADTSPSPALTQPGQTYRQFAGVRP